jgi:hypothetical protein
VAGSPRARKIQPHKIPQKMGDLKPSTGGGFYKLILFFFLFFLIEFATIHATQRIIKASQNQHQRLKKLNPEPWGLGLK